MPEDHITTTTIPTFYHIQYFIDSTDEISHSARIRSEVGNKTIDKNERREYKPRLCAIVALDELWKQGAYAAAA